MTIGEFAKESGMTIDTLRYYDKIGILCPNRRGKNRAYDDSDLEKLNLINRLKLIGWTLEEIKGLFDVEGKIAMTKVLSDESRIHIEGVQGMVSDKLNEIIELESNLKTSKKMLKKMNEKLKGVLDNNGFNV